MSVEINKKGEVTLSSDVVKYHGIKGIRQFVDEAHWGQIDAGVVVADDPEEDIKEKDEAEKKAKDFSLKSKVKTVFL